MQAWEERALDIKDAEERGLEQGLEQGLDRATDLYKLLFSQNRFDDLQQALNDASYRKELLDKLHL